jgi:hypothetical protein
MPIHICIGVAQQRGFPEHFKPGKPDPSQPEAPTNNSGFHPIRRPEMSIITVFELTTMTREKYDALLKGLAAAGATNPEGRQYHTAGVQEDGSIVVTDVWTSAELLESFGAVLIPELEKVGVTPVQPSVYPIHNVING